MPNNEGPTCGLQRDIEFSVTTATQETATMAIEQIKHALK